MIKRRRSRKIKVGGVAIGGDAPITIQSMVKSETSRISATVAEIKRLEDNGCEIVRLAVKTDKDADAIRAIKRKIKIPLVADIHFDYRLALQAIRNGADKIRLNPGNIRKPEEIKSVIAAAKKARIPIRIGINSGSLVKVTSHPSTSLRAGRSPFDFAQGRQVTGEKQSPFVASALGYVKFFEESDFRDIIISLKSSDVVSTIEAYRDMAARCDYPLHLGVTASGPYDSGIVKSAIGIGALLVDGIGDTIRVSLTEDSVSEVIAAKRILSSLELRRFGPEIISCPTCGRCQVDLVEIVKKLEYQLMKKRPLGQGITVAVMGCEVNGPGEAREATVGLAAGKGSGVLFVKGQTVRKVTEKDFVKELMKEIEKL